MSANPETRRAAAIRAHIRSRRLRREASLPNAKEHRPDPDYLRALIEQAGLTQINAAEAIGVDHRTMRRWLLGERPIPYLAQYAVEQLAAEAPET